MDTSIMAAKEKQDEFLVDDETSDLYWKRQVALMDERAAKAFARDEGRDEGRQQILALLKSGKSPEEIIREFETKQN